MGMSPMAPARLESPNPGRSGQIPPIDRLWNVSPRSRLAASPDLGAKPSGGHLGGWGREGGIDVRSCNFVWVKGAGLPVARKLVLDLYSDRFIQYRNRPLGLPH